MLTEEKSLQAAYESLAARPSSRYVYICEIVLRSCIVSLFVVSALPHVANPLEFLNMVNRYRIVPVNMAVLVAALVPVFELASAIALLTDTFVEATWFWTMCLFGLFACAQGIVLWKGMHIECGCFGTAVHLNVSLPSVLVLIALTCCSGFFWRVHALSRTQHVKPLNV